MDDLLLLPKQLLSTERKIIKAAALLNLQGQPIAIAGISKNRLQVLAGRFINSLNACDTELGWSDEGIQVWVENPSDGHIVLSKIQFNIYLFLLSNSCLKGQVQSILDVVEQKFSTPKNSSFLAQCEKQLCGVIGPIGKRFIKNSAYLYEDSPEKFLVSLEQDLYKNIKDPQQVNLFKQQIKENHFCRRQS